MGKKAQKTILERFSQSFDEPRIERLREAYPEGKVISGIELEGDEKVFGVYRKKYYLTPKRVVIREGKTLTSVLYDEIHRIQTVWGGYDNPHHVIVLENGTKIEVRERDFFLNVVIGVLARLKKRVPRGRVKVVGPPHLQQFSTRMGPRNRKLFRFENRQEAWQRMIRCDCETGNQFTIWFLGERCKTGEIADFDLQRQRVELGCASCSKRFVLFDAWHHGYDAVICELATGAPKRRKATSKYACRCDGTTFSVMVHAEYLERDELVDLEPEQWDHAFTWFTAKIQCSQCLAESTLIDYECA